jgi:hypothetical protein
MKIDARPSLEGRKKLVRDSSGFKFLSPNGIYKIDPNFRAALGNKSSFRTSQEHDDKTAPKQ